MSTHFNLAMLMENPSCDNQVNAPTTETAAGPPNPSTSTADQETYNKTPYRSKSNYNGAKWPQPTGTVPPTCRRNSKYNTGIPAGYESDDSWDHNSNIVESTHTHSHNIVPLVALRSWTTPPSRGRN